MRRSRSQLGNVFLPIPKLFRQLEQEIETVIKVLQPGPLGIAEHKFSADETRQAAGTVRKAVVNWRRNAILEQNKRRFERLHSQARTIIMPPYCSQ